MPVFHGSMSLGTDDHISEDKRVPNSQCSDFWTVTHLRKAPQTSLMWSALSTFSHLTSGGSCSREKVLLKSFLCCRIRRTDTKKVQWSLNSPHSLSNSFSMIWSVTQEWTKPGFVQVTTSCSGDYLTEHFSLPNSLNMSGMAPPFSSFLLFPFHVPTRLFPSILLCWFWYSKLTQFLHL